MKGLGIGRIVRFLTIDEGAGNVARVRAGLVTKVFTDDGLVNLSVFNDGTEDGIGHPPVVQKTSVPFDAEGKRHYSWHWPERV